MSENVRKLVGVAAMAALVVVGVVATSGGDDVDFTRNAKIHSKQMALPEAEQARAGNSFMQQAAPKALDTGRLEKTGIIWMTPKPNVTESTGAGNTDKAGIWLQSGGTDALGTGKASVLKGRGVDGKGGTSSLAHAGTASPSYPVLSGRKAGIWLQNGGVDGVADRIEKCANVTSAGNDEAIKTSKPYDTLKNLLVVSIRLDADCQTGTAPLAVSFPDVDQRDAELLAACMESKVGDVMLKSHIEASAADCVATVLPALSPDRAKRLGTYWQTPEQLTALLPALASETNEE
jgi:hypothetical protein